MIDRIHGRLVHKSPTGIVVDVGGVGLAMSVPLSTYERLSGLGDDVSIVTYLHVRQDILELYGFSSAIEREIFLRLLKVSGVGPKLALAVLSRFEPNDLTQVVSDGDVKRLSTVSGIGRKTAERLMVELRDQLKVRPGILDEPITGEISAVAEAIRALEVLGYPIARAEQAVRLARRKLGEDAPVDELVKQALKGV